MNDSQQLFVAQYEKNFPIKIEDIRMSKEPKSKTLARHGSLDEYVDSLPAYEDRTINSALEARKVKVGSKWTVLNEYHTAISDDILAAGEVEVYKLASSEWGDVMVTVIFGEGETDEFELCLFVKLFKHKPIVDDTFNNDTPAQTFGDIKWDMGTQDKGESILVTVCSKCGSTVPADSVDSLALGELKDDGYQDWLKRRNRMNGEIVYYKRYQMELLKKYSCILVGLMGFVYLVFS
ncbi:hypothetical protein BTW00_02195 [Psychrobacter sp. C 20.9]|uniref:hypothetical protein n=1 Tax=Psychrobacter sp. C 20.9 TaxID=1926477 RepID=UPI000946F925|nr:hypothetical protein [Psychrobacter sp. C 20.9]OLF37991.1 hypothetical protein BTW00_02195 [Psychrobacter sp. C 20.9]